MLSSWNSPTKTKKAIETFKYNQFMDTNKINLPKDFFKQFKSKEEFHDFFQSLFKDGV